MTCRQIQLNLSLYLYGELDFAGEEQIEQHLDVCDFCQRALTREKDWHAALKSDPAEVSLELLAECRRDLKQAVASCRARTNWAHSWWNWTEVFGFRATNWSMQVALASFLVFLGFGAARWADKAGFFNNGAFTQMGLAGPVTRVRDIQPDGKNGVRILVDQVREEAVTGRADDQNVQRLLLAAMQDPTDAGIRIYSVEVLKGQNSETVRDALLNSVKRDPNAAVRLKALDGLRQFSTDPPTVNTLRYVLGYDSNPDVRAEAIDVLAPANRMLELTPDLTGTLENLARSEQENDYVRLRCMQILQQARGSLDVY